MDKTEIRNTIRNRRMALSTAEVKRLSKKIVNRLAHYLDWKSIQNLHVYQTIERLHEVDTKTFIDFLKDKHSTLSIYHPESTPPELDVVIVPLLAFDMHGYRVGHGGGYYDRFLKNYPTAKKIGLAYELQKIDQIPAEAHDVPLDAVITEDKIYNFTK